jgi:hypothetical protein
MRECLFPFCRCGDADAMLPFIVAALNNVLRRTSVSVHIDFVW